MSLSSPRHDLHPPCISRVFALTAGGTTIIFADSNPSDLAVPNGAPGGNAGINHLPDTLWLIVTTAGTFIWTDVYGNINTLTFPVVGGPFLLPFTARTIGNPAATQGTAAGELVASWQPGA